MSYTVTLDTPASLSTNRGDLQHLRWDPVFVLPCWLAAWCECFGSGCDPLILTVKQGEEVLGIAPLVVARDTASFMGSADVCDYLDFIVAPGREQQFFEAMLDTLRQKHIRRLELDCLRHESTALGLAQLAKEHGHAVSCEIQDVTVGLDLPTTWDGYLETLNPKQRREVGRKLRRLEEIGDIDYSVMTGSDAIERLDVFFQLLRESREDKAEFMTPLMEGFFKAASANMAEQGMLGLGLLNVDAAPVAAVMYFDYQNSVYLYNSGYDPHFASLSVGLLSKVLCIKDSIRRQRDSFDFLKGAEVYKYRLGGRETPIYRCRIDLE